MIGRMPESDLITRRYLRLPEFTREALARLADAGEDTDLLDTRRDAAEQATELPIRLGQQRLEAVLEAVRNVGAGRVVDLGCGEGWLLERLIVEPAVTYAVGVDASIGALKRAEQRLKLDGMSERRRERNALCIAGNHEVKLRRALEGRNVTVSHGLAESLEQLQRRAPEFAERVAEFIDSLISHYVLDGGRLVVAHAGLPERYHGRSSGRVRDLALYGDTDGETDEFGLPVRYQWAGDYRGEAAVVYGHTPVPAAAWLNNTICIDTGAVFGGELTALRWPERDLVSVPAVAEHYEPIRPADLVAGAPPRPSLLLDVSDVLGKHHVETTLAGRLLIEAERSSAALEVMSRFAADPRWLVHLPPTMAPSAASGRDDYLEHPDEVFSYFRRASVDEVVVQEKHMGSRAVLGSSCPA